ncbi:MAG: L-2-hydroxyglutarate oxidase [Nitriliruptoraceae bacterium]
MTAEQADVAIIGGGLVGLATAYRLLEAEPGLDVTVLEATGRVGAAQSGRNSGVIHAGLYYTPGSAKARLTARGRAQLLELCEEERVEVATTGKLVLAVDESELPGLRALEERGRTNGVATRWLGAEEITRIEPAATGMAALHVPSTAVVDFTHVSAALARRVAAAGGTIRLGAPVTDLRADADHVDLTIAGSRSLRADTVVVCAGLQADRLAGLQDPDVLDDLRIVAFRGSWLKLRPDRAHLVNGSIYPVPAPGLPFLGVHLTKRVDGEVWIGPNAVLASAREGETPGSISLRDLREVASFPGTWRLARHHLGVGVGELWRDRVLSAMLREVRRYVPAISRADVARGPWGVRAQAVRRDGSLVDDFVLRRLGRVVHVLNAPSPAATASLAIGEELRDQVLPLVHDGDG